MPHWETGAELGILDLERAVKISGAMFSMFRGQGATLSRALCQLALDRNADAFEEIRPPTLVLTETLTATGQLPKFADDAYHLERDDLWCIPTAEVPLTSIAEDEILAEAELPTRLMAYSPCFRREAGSAGRDTRGPAAGPRVRQGRDPRLRHPGAGAGDARRDRWAGPRPSIAVLGLTYRVLDICTGDIGQSHHRSFDIEVYAPGRRPVARGLVGVVVQRLPGPAGQHPVPARPRARAPRWCTRSTGRPSPCPACGPPSSRPTARSTDRCASPSALLPYMRGATEIR